MGCRGGHQQLPPGPRPLEHLGRESLGPVQPSLLYEAGLEISRDHSLGIPKQLVPRSTCEAPTCGQQGLSSVLRACHSPCTSTACRAGPGPAEVATGTCTLRKVKCAALWVASHLWASWAHLSAGWCEVTTVQGRGRCGDPGPPCVVLRALLRCLWPRALGHHCCSQTLSWGPIPAACSLAAWVLRPGRFGLGTWPCPRVRH